MAWRDESHGFAGHAKGIHLLASQEESKLEEKDEENLEADQDDSRPPQPTVAAAVQGLLPASNSTSQQAPGKRWELSWVGNSPRRSPTPPRPPESTDELKEDEDHDDGDNDHHEEDEDEDDVDDQDIHKRLPSLHLRARCIKCENVGVVYCKGCEAHLCAKHDQRRHRFMFWKDKHQHTDLPGISYFREDRGRGDRGSPGDLSEATSSETSTPQGTVGISLESAESRGVRIGSRGRATGQSWGPSGDTRGENVPGVEDPTSFIRGSGTGAEPRRGKTESRRSTSAIDMAWSGWYDKIVMAIVRPPRCKYAEQEMGPLFTPIGPGLTMKRRDFVVQNRRGLKLVCTQWHPTFAEDTSRLPCVVYLHGNSSARVDVVKTRALTVLAAAACTVVSFDFSGSGMSEGDWVTLGYFEQHDVADVLAYLRSNGMANRYLLWGRSMGAASAMLYAERYPNSDLCGLILDSPFCSFKRLAKDLVTEGQVKVPGFLVNGALGMFRRSVRKRTRCDLKTVAPILRAKQIQCPSLFIAARKDVMVRPSHGADLSEAVGGPSLFITCRGTHNTPRPGVVLAAIGTFVKGCFRAPDFPIREAFEAIQNKLAEAQATNYALRTGRHSSSAMRAMNRSSGNVGGQGGEGGAGGAGRESCAQRDALRPGASALSSLEKDSVAGGSGTDGDPGKGKASGAAGAAGAAAGTDAGGGQKDRKKKETASRLVALRLGNRDRQDRHTGRGFGPSGSGSANVRSSPATSFNVPRDLVSSARMGSTSPRFRQHKSSASTEEVEMRRTDSSGDAGGGGSESSGPSYPPGVLPSWRDNIFEVRAERGASWEEFRASARESSGDGPLAHSRHLSSASSALATRRPRSSSDGGRDSAAASKVRELRPSSSSRIPLGASSASGDDNPGPGSTLSTCRDPSLVSSGGPQVDVSREMNRSSSCPSARGRAKAQAELIRKSYGENLKTLPTVLSVGDESGSGRSLSETGASRHLYTRDGSGKLRNGRGAGGSMSQATFSTRSFDLAGSGTVPPSIPEGRRPSRPLRRTSSTLHRKNSGRLGGSSKRGVSRSNSASGGWWGRVRIKTPTLYVFRRRREKNFLREDVIPETAGLGPRAGSKGRSGDASLGVVSHDFSSTSCRRCDMRADACMCDVMMPLAGHTVIPETRTGVLRTPSGKLKM